VRAYRIAYDGQPYHGFQRQPDVQTVEDAILDALGALDVLDGATNDDGSGHRPTPPGYAAAGRTDAGVSALAQTVAFEAPEWLTPAALNSELPADVRAWASADAPQEFHATHDADSRTYTYYLHAPDADDERARDALDALAGEHDFHNLTPDDDGTVRTLSTALARDGEFLVVTLTAGGFARQLVRRIVSVVAEVARGTSPRSRVGEVLAERSLSGPEGVSPAPARGLVLTDVTYPGLPFETDESAAASARAVFDQRRVEHAIRARVSGRLSDL
jgi:tRNA pseudouridine38-40 synthase